MKMKKLRITAFVCMLAMAVSLLAACGTQTQNSPPSSSAPAQESSAATSATPTPAPTQKEPATISIMTYLFDPEPPAADNPILKKIEEMTNTKLDITWVPSASYNDKVNLTIASGEMPEMIDIGGDLVRAPSIVNAMRAGVFWEVGPYMKNYPNLSKAKQAINSNISLDGKTYGLYRERWLTRNGIVIRKDWLDNLGLQEPKTLDDLYNVLKAFTLDDPDKNGKNDTVGLSDRKDLLSFYTMASYFGAPNLWDVQDGKFVPWFMTKEFMDCMDFYRKIYSEKLINQDFAVAQDYNTLFDKGGAGMTISALDDADAHGALLKSDPKAQIDVIGQISGPKGIRTPAGAGHNGEVLFTKSGIKSEDQLKTVLDFMDKIGGGKDIADLMMWGIEGQTYSLDNGVPTQTQDQSTAYSKLVNPFWQIFWSDVSVEATPGNTAPLTAKYTKMINDDVQYAVINPAAPLISETMAQNGNQLNQIWQDAQIKYIMGSIDLAGWNKAIDQWKSTGGDKVIEEYNAEYQKTQGK